MLAYYRQKDADSVVASVNWFSLDGVVAYKSLAIDHFDAVRSQLRSDLENGFERIRKQSIEMIEASLGKEYAKKLAEEFKKLDDFVRSQFTEAALAGLAVNGEASDAQFGRQYLGSSLPLAAAVRILCRFGTPEDVPALLNVARTGWGDARDEAGICALRLSTTPFDIARELIHSNSPKLVQPGYAWLYAQRSPEVIDFFEALFDAEDGSGHC